MPLIYVFFLLVILKARASLNGFAMLLQFHKRILDEHERDLQSAVHSVLLSINEIDLSSIKAGPCNASCIRFTLVKLLRLSGYDAAVCSSRWPGKGKVPGGRHLCSTDIFFVTSSDIHV